MPANRRAGQRFFAGETRMVMLPVTGMVPVLPDFTAQRFPGLGQFASHLFMSVNMIGALVGGILVGFASRIGGGGAGTQILSGMPFMLTDSALVLAGGVVGGFALTIVARRLWR